MSKARLITEIVIVLGLSIGMSALYSIVNIAVRLSREAGLSSQTAGLDGSRWGRDSAAGLGLAALIGIPGLGLYLLGRELDLTVTVVPSALNTYWWTIPMLIALALRAGILEEVIAVGYLFARLRQLGVSMWPIIMVQAVLRASYHLYQGFGAFIGNFVMGLIFGWIYAKTGRLAPLIVGHTVIDIVAFVGYPLALSFLPETLGFVL